MNIAEIRAKYPQYDHASDEQLANAMHEKYYPHVPKDVFYERIGYVPQQPEGERSTGLAGVGSDVLSGIEALPSAFYEMLKALPSEASGAANQLYKNPKRFAQNVGAGLGQMGQGILNTPGNVRDYLADKELISDETPSLRLPEKLGALRFPREFNYGEALGREGEEPGDALISGLVESLPYMMGGELGLAGKSGTRKLAQRSAAQGALGVSENENPITTALMTPAFEGLMGIPKAIGKIEDLAPTKMYRGELSPEELQKNLEATTGTETSLGEVIGSPRLQRFLANILTKVPFSGANEALQRGAKQATTQSENALKGMLGDVKPEQVTPRLQQSLQDASKKVTQEKIQKYNKANELADKEGVVIGRNNIAKAAQEILDEINQSPELKRSMSSQFLSDIQDATNLENANNLKRSDIFRGKIEEKAKEAYMNQNDFEGTRYSQLKNALDEDINSEVNAKGSPELKKLHGEARKYYEDYYAPFQDKDIVRFTRKGGDPDLLVNHFLKITNVADRPRLLKKFLEKISPDNRKLVQYAYYSRALKEGAIDPLKMKALHKNLGEEQKQVLFNDKKAEKAMDNVARLVGKNAKGLKSMLNLETGQQALDVGVPLGLYGSGAALGGTLGGFPGMALGGLAGFALPGLISKPIVKRLTEPAYREKFVNKMLEREGKAKTPDNKKIAKEAIRKALIGTGSKLSAPLEIELNKYAKKESDEDKK